MKKIQNKRQRPSIFKSRFSAVLMEVPARVSHIIIAIATCVFLVIIAEWDIQLLKSEFIEGDIAVRSIYAPYDYSIKGEIDYTATENAKKIAMDSISPVYALNPAARDLVLNKIGYFSDFVRVLKGGELSNEDKLLKIKGLAAPYNISEMVAGGILELKEPHAFFTKASEIAGFLINEGVIAASEISKLKEESIKRITLLDTTKKTEQERPLDGLINISEIKKKIELFLISVKDKKERSLLVDFLDVVLIPNIAYDQVQTDLKKQAIAEKVQPIYSLVEIKKNELVLNKGERITKEHLAKLKGIEQNESYPYRQGAFFGIAILIILFMLLLALYIEFYEPDLVVGNKELMLLTVICILIILAAKAIVISPWPSILIPASVASMLIAILLNSRLAVITTCFLSILIGMMSGNRLDIAAVSVVGGMTGIFAVRNVRRRSQIITAGFSIGFANMTYLIGVGMVNALDFHAYIIESFLGLANGIISAIIVTGVLPIFENVFKIPTDISLLELADLNHPVLKEMVIKAPGTYHHSLVVGNLAEAACETINANALLARVSSYFHDIGKIEKASYFSENQSITDSAHDKLSPTMSSLIITNHVKNGVELAEKYKLTRRIIDIIRQHHGTGLVFYFFKRALEKTVDEEVAEEGFRYSGPKPQTREAACVLLADSVEAASRSLDDPTPASIEGLVRRIINNKFIDGQLDECDLTLKDLERIAGVFTHILTGIYHTRVEYPEDTGKKKP